MGFKSPPEQEEATFKWLFMNNLRSKTLGQIQNLDPPPPDVPIKSKTTEAKEFAIEHNCRLVLKGTRDSIIAFNGAMLSGS